jgi:hypothetical protein
MAFELRNKDVGDAAHTDDVQQSVPGRRTAVNDNDAAANPGLFAGSADWEDVDPMALAEAQTEDDDADVGPADDEGELDTDDEQEEAEPQAAQAPPGNAQVANAASTSNPREGRESAPQPTAQAAKAPKAKTYRVNRAYRDGPYGGTAKYDVRVTAKAITMIVGIRLSPKKGVTAAQVRKVKSASQAIFKQKYDGRFRLTEIPYKPRPLKATVRFSGKAHHNVALHKGSGRDNAANWYVKGDNTTRAHEIGHLLGLLDEYADSASPDRAVHTDNSLMGNYYQEGIKTANLKKRHGNVFARDISKASGRKFYRSP